MWFNKNYQFFNRLHFLISVLHFATYISIKYITFAPEIYKKKKKWAVFDTSLTIFNQHYYIITLLILIKILTYEKTIYSIVRCPDGWLCFRTESLDEHCRQW